MRGSRAFGHPARSAALALIGFVATGCGTNVDLGGEPLDAANEARHDVGTCAAFAGPDASAPCSGCDMGDEGCQPNGCFNGYLCDVAEHDCKAPGTLCSDDGKFDAH